MKEQAIPVDLPIYKIAGRYYFRDERLGEYRNICDPSDRKPLDSVLEKATKIDSENVEKELHKIHKEAANICDKNPCKLKIKGNRRELALKKEIDEMIEEHGDLLDGDLDKLLEKYKKLRGEK